MRDVERTREEFVNHEPPSSDLRILREFLQHLKLVNMMVVLL